MDFVSSRFRESVSKIIVNYNNSLILRTRVRFMNPAENYILSKPEPWRSMLIELQAIIKQTVPEVEEAYKWHLPFYSLQGKMFCFLNFRKKFVDVGFPWGIHITLYPELLIGGEGRKNLRSLRYYSPEEIDVKILQEILRDVAGGKKGKKILTPE